MPVAIEMSEWDCEDLSNEMLVFSIGRTDNEPTNFPQILWFSPEFLEAGYSEVHAPLCIWKSDGSKVFQTNRRNGREDRIWILTDKYDDRGFRLGVWPD